MLSAECTLRRRCLNRFELRIQILAHICRPRPARISSHIIMEMCGLSPCSTECRRDHSICNFILMRLWVALVCTFGGASIRMPPPSRRRTRARWSHWSQQKENKYKYWNFACHPPFLHNVLSILAFFFPPQKNLSEPIEMGMLSLVLDNAQFFYRTISCGIQRCTAQVCGHIYAPQ